MRIKWCGVFWNRDSMKRLPPYYIYVGFFDGDTADEIKELIQKFIKEMAIRKMSLIDQEILDVED